MTRLLRALQVLMKIRGNAYGKLNMNGLSPLLQQFVPPDFQLGHDVLDACGLFDGFGLNLTGVMGAK